jgi:hypothetical protein
MFAAHYENEPRITVDRSNAAFRKLAARFCKMHGFDPQVVLLMSRPLIALIGLLYAETALFLNDAAMFTHECVVSVNLAGKSQPASRDNFQRTRLSLIRR